MTDAHSAPKPSDDVHEWFGLSYGTHAVLPRVLMQSMPAAWQQQFVALMVQFEDAFDHVEQPSAYSVQAASQHLVNELLPDQLNSIGYTVDERDYDQMPEGLSVRAIAEWEDDHPTHYYDADGNEVDGSSYVYVPAPDPLPSYSRGRTYIEPRLSGCAHCPDGHAAPTSRPWGVYVADERDGDGQPTYLRVGPSDGAHVAQSDADWLWQLIRDSEQLQANARRWSAVSDTIERAYRKGYDVDPHELRDQLGDLWQGGDE